MTAAPEPVEHLLALKVMRLTRPTLVSPTIVTCEPKDLPHNKLNELMRRDPLAGKTDIALGQFMLLPQSFGNIYLGESFSSYICVHNCTTHPVTNVSVRADLQSTSNRISLPIHSNKQLPVTLNVDETLDDVIHHEVVEIGTHILVCEVSYSTSAGLPASFRKFFKFQVVKPLDVKTKFSNVDAETVFLEAQIQNITAGTICLEKVELEGTDQYTVTKMNALTNGEALLSTTNEMLEPQNSCQFLYCMKPVQSATLNPGQKLSNDVGKLDIVWRSNLGQRGRLQTTHLQRSPIECTDLRLSIIEAKSSVRIGCPFHFKCRVTNTSDHNMELMLNFKTKPRIDGLYTGQTEFMLGSIAHQSYKDFELTICPVKTGLITITNLELTEVFNKKSYTFEDFLQVFVVDRDYKETDFYEVDQNVKFVC